MATADALATLRAWLLMDGSPVPATLGTRPDDGESVYVNDSLPDGIDPEQGLAITITQRGGAGHPEMTFLLRPDVQVKVWGGKQQVDEVRAAYRAIYDQIHGKNGIAVPGQGTVISCVEVGGGQNITDPNTGWATLVAFFRMMVR